MTDAEKIYKDIIHKKWPADLSIYRNHPRMTLENRAKQFAPFAPLRGHKDRLGEEAGKLMYSGRLELSQEEAAILSNKISQIEKGMAVTVIYFAADSAEGDMGYYLSLSGRAANIDMAFGNITIATGEQSAKGEIEITIPFDDILDIISDKMEEEISEATENSED